MIKILQKLVYDMIYMERLFCRCLLIQIEKDQVENYLVINCFAQIYNRKGSTRKPSSSGKRVSL
jgi:hypothetical protein